MSHHCLLLGFTVLGGSSWCGYRGGNSTEDPVALMLLSHRSCGSQWCHTKLLLLTCPCLCEEPWFERRASAALLSVVAYMNSASIVLGHEICGLKANVNNKAWVRRWAADRQSWSLTSSAGHVKGEEQSWVLGKSSPHPSGWFDSWNWLQMSWTHHVSDPWVCALSVVSGAGGALPSSLRKPKHVMNCINPQSLQPFSVAPCGGEKPNTASVLTCFSGRGTWCSLPLPTRLFLCRELMAGLGNLA